MDTKTATYLKVGVGFLVGLLTGAVTTKLYIDHKNNSEEVVYEEYEEVTDDLEEIEKVVDRSMDDDKIQPSRLQRDEDDREDYERVLRNLNYKVEEEREHNEVVYNQEEPLNRNVPYYISKDEYEYDASDAYETDEYTYYADGYVTDSYGMPVTDEDVLNSFGKDFDKYFDKYGVDEICIRNERLKMDFSIIRDLDNFVDVVPSRIRRMAGLE